MSGTGRQPCLFCALHPEGAAHSLLSMLVFSPAPQVGLAKPARSATLKLVRKGPPERAPGRGIMRPNHHHPYRLLPGALLLLLAAGLAGCGSAGTSPQTASGWEDIPAGESEETTGEQSTESSASSAETAEQNSAQWETSQQAASSSSPTRIFVGDSRTVGMYWALSGDDSLDEVHLADEEGNYWDARVGIGLDWMKSTGIPDAVGYLGPGTTLYLLMGVNDMAGTITTEDYLSYLDQEVSSWTGTGASVIYVSVNPVRQEVNGITNEKIDAWNEAMQAGLPEGISYLDTNSQIRDHIDFKDDLHYHDDTNLEIYGICQDAAAQ